MTRCRVILLTVFAMMLNLGALVLAQAPSGQPATPAPNVSVSRSYWFEICLVVVLIGGALWAVCRSSNRQ